MPGPAILIAAQSGRALAQAARRAGLRPFVADLFGDADTLDFAEGHRHLTGRFGTGTLAAERVLASLDELAGMAGSHLGIVLGSGFEGAPDLIRRIGVSHRLLGASPEAVAALKDPFRFAASCARLGIPHPAVTIEPLADPSAWLLKGIGGSGGSHIRRATLGRAPPGAYFQARVPGRAYALNVLADGRRIQVLALTEQWSAPSRVRPFRYAGALAPGAGERLPLPEGMIAAVAESVERIVAETGLRGLASADILAGDGAWWLTEVNPRPGATLDVLDRRAPPLLSAHIAASAGEMPALGAQPVDAAASEICYAAQDHAPVPGIAWPDHVRDRPRAGSTVRRDAPLCTVLATGADGHEARGKLRVRIAQVRAALAEEEAPTP